MRTRTRCVPYGQQYCSVKSEKEERHATTNRGGEGGGSVLLRVESEMNKGHTTTTGEIREETVYSYALRQRWTRRPRHRVRKGGGTHNNQPERQDRRLQTPTRRGQDRHLAGSQYTTKTVRHQACQCFFVGSSFCVLSE